MGSRLGEMAQRHRGTKAQRGKEEPQITQMGADLKQEGGHSCPLKNLNLDRDLDRKSPSNYLSQRSPRNAKRD